MSKPESIKIQPWSDFPRYSYSIFGDDFSHDKLLVAKIAAKGSRSTINIKQTVTNKGGVLNTADEVKYWFDLPFAGHKLYAKFKSSNYIKLHYDCGVHEIKDRKWNFYGSLNCNKALQNMVMKIGASHIHDKCHCDNRLKFEANRNGFNCFWYHRTVINHNKFTFGILGVLDLSKRVLQKSNVLLKYRHDDKSEVFLRMECDGYRKVSANVADPKSYFDTATLDFVHKLNDNTKIALEAAINLKGDPLKQVQAVVERKIPSRNLTVKGRVNNKLDLAVSAKLPVWGLQKLATLTSGVAISKAASRDQKISMGWQVDLNI